MRLVLPFPPILFTMILMILDINDATMTKILLHNFIPPSANSLKPSDNLPDFPPDDDQRKNIRKRNSELVSSKKFANKKMVSGGNSDKPSSPNPVLSPSSEFSDIPGPSTSLLHVTITISTSRLLVQAQTL